MVWNFPMSTKCSWIFGSRLSNFFVILSMNKDYAYIMLTYVVFSISCVDFYWRIVTC
jgi:hypothetical protein